MASALQFEVKLKEIIAGERQETLEILASGGPEDYAAYREKVGFVRALDLFDEWCARVTEALDER